MSVPQILATLSVPFDPLKGRIQACEVHSFEGSRKRKRLEIAAAVDGEGISIHSVRNPRLLTSYATPPHTEFIAPPCSIFQKRHAQHPSRRFTYTTVRHDHIQPNVEVIAFLEEEQQQGPNTANKLQTFRRQADNSSIHSIQVIPTTRISQAYDSPHDVLLVYKRGKIQCISADLQTVRWTATISLLDGDGNAGPPKNGTQVEMAILSDVGAARRGVLRDRPDVLSAIRPSNEHPESLKAIPLLFLLTSTPKSKSHIRRAVQVFALNPMATTTLFALNSTLSLTLLSLASWHLPLLKTYISDQNTNPKYRFAASSASLYELTDHVITYDLSGLVPRVASTFHPLHKSQDLLPLSASLLSIASDDTCAIYDTKFNSLQTRFLCAVESYPGLEMQKQKAAVLKNLKSDPTFVCYFSDLGLIVALQHNSLIGFQQTPNQNPLKRKRGSTRLIDSIQKGVSDHVPQTSLLHSHTGQHPLKKVITGLVHQTDEVWKSQISELDACVEANDIHRFEKIFFGSTSQVLSKSTSNGRISDHNQSSDIPHLNGTIKGTSSAESSSTRAIKSADGQEKFDPAEVSHPQSSLVHKQKTTFALGKIFALREQHGSNGQLSNPFMSPLYIKFFPPNVFRDMAATGQLTSHMVEQALSDENHHFPASPRFKSSDVTRAIFNHDTSGRLLHQYLSQPVHLDIFEILETIRILATCAAGQQTTLSEKAHSSEKLLSNGDQPLQRLSNEESSSDNITPYEEMLANAVARLYSFPSKQTIHGMQAVLMPREIKAFITMLRQQLSEGGWFSYYLEAQLQNTKNVDYSKTSLTVITQILNCAIDAVGISGWLVGQDMQEISRPILSQLRAEASMILENIHEMQSLMDILTEFSKNGPSSTLSAKVAGPIRHARRHRSSPALPLGRTQDDSVSTMKVGAGGRVKQRSEREIRAELSKKVPEYSLDRIRF